MTDLGIVLPNFSVHKYANLLPSLEKHSITTTDLLTLESLEIAKIALLPVLEIKNLCNAVREALHITLGIADIGESSPDNSTLLKKTGEQIVNNCTTISLLDDGLNRGLRGGIPTGSITEITGESGAGKTQFLVTLSLAVQLPPPQGLSSSTLFISTESTLPVIRIRQLLLSHPSLRSAKPKPSLDQIISIHTPDLESQDHIIYFQVPVAIKRYRVRLLIIDSIASNYRVEFDRDQKPAANLGKRSVDLVKLGQFLRNLAHENNIAIVVANQVADRISDINQDCKRLHPGEETANNCLQALPYKDRNPSSLTNKTCSPLAWKYRTTNDLMSLSHQQRWFTGWGDEPYPSYWMSMNLKTPSLGLIWTTQIACRIALIKKPVLKRADMSDEYRDVEKWRRWQKVVFASHAPESGQGIRSAVEYEITAEGLISVNDKTIDNQDDS